MVCALFYVMVIKMKKMKSLPVVLSLMMGLVSAQILQAKPAAPTQHNIQSVLLDIQNMSCAMCPFTIRKALQGVAGVRSAKVDFESKTANVMFDPQKTNIETLIKATTNVGYPATVHLEK